MYLSTLETDFYCFFFTLTSSPKGLILLKLSLDQNMNKNILLKAALSTYYLLSSCSYQKTKVPKEFEI